MSVSIGNQAYIFLSCVFGGMIIAFIYDIFRVRRKTIKSGNLMVYFEDFIYWIIVALVLFAVVYYSNEGEIRGYLIIGIALGIILYTLVFSKIVMKIFLFVVRIIYKVIITISSLILVPIKIICKILMLPLRKIYKYINISFMRARKVGKINIVKLKGYKRLIKNIRKKI
ncbi:UNVERIFIED_CONTAM: spore cortex biosynthesis protein YabQ [Acetivibrio alkalicellulosi]